MRTISASSLLKLSQKTGTEPLTIIETQWETGGSLHIYGDKKTEGVDGRIISVSAFNDILNMSSSGVSQSINFVLSDHDGHLKNVFNTVDLQKKQVYVYQWFTGIPLSEKILLFIGSIESPITWNEGDRTLSFSVVSKADGEEVGFSPEEGTFPNLPDNLVGQAWPLCFGSPLKVQAILIDDIGQSGGGGSGSGSSAPIIEEPIGIEDPSLQLQIDNSEIKASGLMELMKLYFIGVLQASHTARARGEIRDLESLEKAKGGTFVSLAKQYLQAANKALADAQEIRRKSKEYQIVHEKQKSYNKKTVSVTNGAKYPQNTSMNVNIGGSIYTGFFTGNVFTITSSSHPAASQYSGIKILPLSERTGEPLIIRNSFFYADIGSPVKIGASQGLDVNEDDVILPVRYIVAATLQVGVNAVFARRTVDGTSDIYQVPSNYYEVYNLNFGSLPVTMLFLLQPLSSRTDGNGKNEEWGDDIWVNVTSPVGPNPVHIIQWLISKYTSDTYDPITFNLVASFLSGDPANFVLTDRPNVLKLIADIAYQTRSIIWMKNGVYNMKYLPYKSASVATITEADIIEQTLTVVYTETADLVTKYKASWKSEGSKSKQNLIVIRYNITAYGLIEKSYNYYIFNMQMLVQRTATYWMIRGANTYKRVICTVPISKLNIEALDIITLNFSHNFIANGPIDCSVESAILDTNEYTIQLTIWCPVRAGEMSEYLFAFPAGLGVEYVYPSQNDVRKGKVGSSVDTNQNAHLPTNAPRPELKAPLSGDGNAGSVTFESSKPRPLTQGSNDLKQTTGREAPLIATRVDGTLTNGGGVRPKGVDKYDYEIIPTPKDVFDAPKSTVVPAYIIEPGEDEGTYNVDAYFNGLDNPGITVKNVSILEYNRDDTVAPDTPVMLVRVVWKDEDDKLQIEHYIQVPVWQ